MAKSKRKRLIDNLDEVCRKIVRLRDNYTCQWCAEYIKNKKHDAHHIIRRDRYVLRFDLLNLVLLCYQCHRRFHDGLDGREWFEQKFSARWEYLNMCIPDKNGTLKPRRNMTLKELGIQISDLEALYGNLKQKLKDLQK